MTVTASASDVVTTRTVVSDAEGVATLEALAPSALYMVSARISGFRDYTREAIAREQWADDDDPCSS